MSLQLIDYIIDRHCSVLEKLYRDVSLKLLYNIPDLYNQVKDLMYQSSYKEVIKIISNNGYKIIVEKYYDLEKESYKMVLYLDNNVVDSERFYIKFVVEGAK